MNKIDFSIISELETILIEEKEIINMLTILLNNYFDKRIDVKEASAFTMLSLLVMEHNKYSSLANEIFKIKKENLERLEKLFERLNDDYKFNVISDDKE